MSMPTAVEPVATLAFPTLALASFESVAKLMIRLNVTLINLGEMSKETKTRLLLHNNMDR